jgi:CheY-like chemotaxis protein
MAHKLLLADDSVTIQRVIELTFADEDVQVLTASDGEQAIARLQTDNPDIVLADIGMPKRNGYEVAAFIKNDPAYKHIPVLLLTGAFEPIDETRAEQAGCDGVLVKPFEPQQVITRVRELLRAGKGDHTHAVADVPRPVERLTPSRPVELPKRDAQPEAMATTRQTHDVDLASDGPAQPGLTGANAVEESLDDYFDRLDAAFANLGTESVTPQRDQSVMSVSEPVMKASEGSVKEHDLDWFDERFMRLADLATQSPASDAEGTRKSVHSIDEWLETTQVEMPPSSPIGTPPIEPTDASPNLSGAANPIRSVPAGPTSAPTQATASAETSIADAFSALLAVEQGEPGLTPLRFGAGSAPVLLTDALIDEISHRVGERLRSAALRDVVADVVSRIAEKLVREEIQLIRKSTR